MASRRRGMFVEEQQGRPGGTSQDETAPEPGDDLDVGRLQRLSQAFLHSPNALLMLDAEGLVCEVNAGLSRLLGREANSVVGERFEDLVVDADRTVAVGMRESFVGGHLDVVRQQIRVVAADGQLVTARIRASRIDDESGRQRWLLVSLRDVSELTGRERLAYETEMALQEQRRALGTLLSNLPGMAYRCRNDRDWTMEFVSEGCRELTGHDPQAVLSGAISFAELTHPDDRERVWNDVQEAIAARRPFELTFRLTTASGEQRWMWEQGRAVRSDDGTLAALEGFITDVTAIHRAEAALSHQALHDPLTGLPNRAQLHQVLQRSLAERTPSVGATGVVLLDLDRFKLVNDSFGHGAGDEVLTALARRLETLVRPGDLLTRVGGDEFVVICPGVAGFDDLVRIAGRLRAGIRRPLNLGGRRLVLDASAGLAVAGEATSAETLLREADVALYGAKERGRGSAVAYDAEMGDRALRRLEVESELRDALARDELTVEYQPILALATGQIVGVEALVRWEHPTRGRVPPDAFIPVAEESGLIVELGIRVLRTALADLRSWPPGVGVSVNVSPRQLRAAGFVDAVATTLAATDVEPHRLTLELTESGLVGDVAETVEVLRELKQLGLRLAVDDFGTGYSSLSYLQRFPLDVLKIDREFVAQVGDLDDEAAVAETVISLGRRLGLEVVAEGVERPQQVIALRRHACSHAQGFLWSPSRPAAEITTMLEAPAVGDPAGPQRR